MTTRTGDVVIMHDGHGAASNHYLLWTVDEAGEQRPSGLASMLVRTGLPAARMTAAQVARVTHGGVFLVDLDSNTWTKLEG